MRALSGHLGDAGSALSTSLCATSRQLFCADKHSLQRSIANHVEYTLAGTRFNIDTEKAYAAAAHSVRDRLMESFNDTNAHWDEVQPKRGYYLSMEYLMGRYLHNALLNMDLEEPFREAVRELGFTLEELLTQEPDPALGNGGLGRLAACFLDSMATLDLPAWGYGLRYTYGIFRQHINQAGEQCELPDRWLTFVNPWEVERPDVSYPVRFYGSVAASSTAEGGTCWTWSGGECVLAVAYDNPIPGFSTWNVINLRLWGALPAHEFDLQSFNSGDYMKAVEAKQRAETITSVLYPADSHLLGKELRLKQQYFLVSATLQDILRRFKKVPGRPWSALPDLAAIQLNDTHPSLSIPELMRLLIDVHSLGWDEAWDIVTRTFSYTNHTLLPEALEKWSVDLLQHLLPRHLQIIYEINSRWLDTVQAAFPGDTALVQSLSLVQEGDHKAIRMAHLSVVGSHTVNGVAAIHSQLLKSLVFADFVKVLGPGKFINVTNGVTPRRWIHQANPALAHLITETLGSDAWVQDLSCLKGLRERAKDAELQKKWGDVKAEAKVHLAALIQHATGVEVNPGALFDIQVKRIHEYKRQLMNALGVWHRYRFLKRLSKEARGKVQGRVFVFAGKAAPGYAMAKRIIKMLNCMARHINGDPDTAPWLKLIFIPNYNVSVAEVIIPASDVSEHISTAGTEASGTSNMKFAMNGGLIIGTKDGANIEIAAEIGDEHMFTFGAEAHDVPALQGSLPFVSTEDSVRLHYEVQVVLDDLRSAVGDATVTYGPHACSTASEGAAAAHARYLAGPPAAGGGTWSIPPVAHGSDLPAGAALRGVFGSDDDVRAILGSVVGDRDQYLVKHDFAEYLQAQARVDAAFNSKAQWEYSSIMSTAGMGFFSTDRTISQYAREVWGLVPCKRPAPTGTLSDLEADEVTEG